MRFPLPAALSARSLAEPGAAMKNRSLLSEAESDRIHNVSHFGGSLEARFVASEILDFYIHWFVDPFLAQSPTAASIADIGAGYGWLSIALALRSESRTVPRILAVELNEKRLSAARKIAEIVGVADRIQWCVASLGCLPFNNGAFDAVFAIEVVEHISSSKLMMEDLSRICLDKLTITTPNLLFPVIHHDTRLLFCHWLPISWRNVYARLFRRSHLQDANRFWSPRGLVTAVGEFECTSGFMHFSQWDDYVRANQQLPRQFRKSGLLHLWHRMTRVLGPRSSYILPTCSMTLRRKTDGNASRNIRGFRLGPRLEEAFLYAPATQRR